MAYRTETELWLHLSRCLIGRWQRIEVLYPAGFPDVMGWPGAGCAGGRPLTHFLELKCGSPTNPEQRAWLAEAIDSGVPVWLAEGSGPAVRWYRDPAMDLLVAAPWFYRPSNSRVLRRAASAGTSSAARMPRA